MTSGRTRLLMLGCAAVALGVSGTVSAHRSGFHKRVVVRVSEQRLQAVVTLDLDGGDRAMRLRVAADGNHDGKLDERERASLKARLSTLLLRPLRLSIASYGIKPELRDAKLNLRGDLRVSETGISIAALLENDLPGRLIPGMELVVEDEAPDRSHVEVEVHPPCPDAGATDCTVRTGTIDVGGAFRARL